MDDLDRVVELVREEIERTVDNVIAGFQKNMKAFLEKEIAKIHHF